MNKQIQCIIHFSHGFFNSIKIRGLFKITKHINQNNKCDNNKKQI